MHSTLWKFSASWKLSLHIFYVLKITWRFSSKGLDQRFSRNIFTPLRLHFDRSTLVQRVISRKKDTIYKFQNMLSVRKLH